MAPRHFMISLAIVAAAAAPALAQDHNRRDNRAQSQQTEHARREQPQAQRAQPQRAPERAPQQVYRAPQQVNRAPQQVYRAPQAVQTPQVSRAPQAQRAPEVWQNERAVPRAVPQPQRPYRYGYNGRSYDGRSYDRGAYANPRIIRPTIVQVLPYRPYVYRPSWSIGVYYGSGGYYPYGYTPDYYFDPIPGHYYGGLRITGAPREARVFADGYFVGIVDDFDGIFQHLNLEAGPHHIEIQADGYAPVAFDVNVRPGQTITFRADPAFFQPIG